MPNYFGSRRKDIAKSSMTSTFDPVAIHFERYRSLRAEVSEAIRYTIWTAIRPSGPAWALEVGAGTGRIGRAFVAAGDFYVGLDTSFAMLREFSLNSKSSTRSKSCFLVQADGACLPFRSRAFDVVLLIQVLSGTDDWRTILDETLRVLRPGGSIVVGRTVSPESGIDAQLKHRLKLILEEMQVAWHQPRESRRQALSLLSSSAVHHLRLEAAQWDVQTTVGEFLLRRRTGARFAALPFLLQEEALKKLRSWAETTFGSTETTFQERRSFELDVFEF